MVSKLWEDHADVEKKLTGGVVLHKGKPYYVAGFAFMGTTPGITGKYLPLPGSYALVSLADPELDLSGIFKRLGYMNTEHDSVWVSRMPIRNVKMGLNESSLFYNTKPLPRLNLQYPFGFEFGNLVADVGFYHMLTGDYPTYKQCIAAFKKSETLSGKAFHKFFALTRREKEEVYSLEYKGYEIAQSADPNNLLLTKPHYKEIVEHYEIEHCTAA